jgi:hypothetical protein
VSASAVPATIGALLFAGDVGEKVRLPGFVGMTLSCV